MLDLTTESVPRMDRDGADDPARSRIERHWTVPFRSPKRDFKQETLGFLYLSSVSNTSCTPPRGNMLFNLRLTTSIMAKPPKYPEFADLEAHVWEYLNQPGQTISAINRKHEKEYPGLSQHTYTKNDAVWYNKQDLDAYVANSIGKSMKDYGHKTRNNPLYNKLVHIVSKLRKKGILVDWDRTRRWGTGVGIWKIDKIKLESYQTASIRHEMSRKNFAATGITCAVHVRLKQQEFRSRLIKEYGRCVFCGFDIERYTIGAHIVPYCIMRMSDPLNAMNPSNGLLTCRLCDVAFESNTIVVENDLSVMVSEELRDNPNRAVKSWAESITPKIHIRPNASYPPDPAYLEKKRSLKHAVHAGC